VQRAPAIKSITNQFPLITIKKEIYGETPVFILIIPLLAISPGQR